MAGRRGRTMKKSEAIARLTAEDGTQFLGWDPQNPLAHSDKLSESAKANQALIDYAVLGVARSMRKLLEAYQAQAKRWTEYQADPNGWLKKNKADRAPIEPPTATWMTLTDWSVKYFWQERVKRFDEIQNELERLEFEGERRQLKKQRIEILKATLNRLRLALASLDPKKAAWSEVTNGIWRISQALREEFGDDLGEGNMAGRVRMVVIKMPPDAHGVMLEPASDDLDDEEADLRPRRKVRK